MLNSIHCILNIIQIKTPKMKLIIEWDLEKNLVLKESRGVCFEDVEAAISDGKLLDILPHHNPKKYPNQKVFIVEIYGYIHYIPFVEEGERIFLKTIIPSRKYNKKLQKNVKK